MFRINKLTDYAVVVLVNMARRERTRSAQQVASETGVPLPTVAKVMKLLARYGLVDSERGVTGGYRLARTPQDITIADMIQAIEGPIALTSCVGAVKDDCSIEGGCPMSGHWNRVNRVVHEALSEVTLADMAADRF